MSTSQRQRPPGSMPLSVCSVTRLPATAAASRPSAPAPHWARPGQRDGGPLPAVRQLDPAAGAGHLPRDADRRRSGPRPGRRGPPGRVRPTTTRAQQVAAVDARVAAVLKAAPAGTDVVLASLADAGVTERLRLIAVAGPHFGAGTLESSSTRQPGLVQLTDLTPTILQHLGIPRPPSWAAPHCGSCPRTTTPSSPPPSV